MGTSGSEKNAIHCPSTHGDEERCCKDFEIFLLILLQVNPSAAFCYSSRDSLVATADASAPRSALEAQAALSAQPQGVLPERTPTGLCTNQVGGDRELLG